MNETINQTINSTNVNSILHDSKTIFQYIGNGLSWAVGGIRDNLIKLFDGMNMNGNFYVPIVFLLISLFLGYKIVTKFVTTPFSSKYVIWYIIVSLLIFSFLNYI